MAQSWVQHGRNQNVLSCPGSGTNMLQRHCGQEAHPAPSSLSESSPFLTVPWNRQLSRAAPAKQKEPLTAQLGPVGHVQSLCHVLFNSGKWPVSSICSLELKRRERVKDHWKSKSLSSDLVWLPAGAPCIGNTESWHPHLRQLLEAQARDFSHLKHLHISVFSSANGDSESSFCCTHERP